MTTKEQKGITALRWTLATVMTVGFLSAVIVFGQDRQAFKSNINEVEQLKPRVEALEKRDQRVDALADEVRGLRNEVRETRSRTDQIYNLLINREP